MDKTKPTLFKSGEMRLNAPSGHRTLFFSAALFNWTVAAIFLLFYRPIFQLIGISPVPHNPVYLHLFACMVALFGLAYYWAAKNLEKNRNLVQLGIIGKLSIFTLVLAYGLSGSVSWQFSALVSVDLVYAILFAIVLRQTASS